jgi:hypothetical protein
LLSLVFIPSFVEAVDISSCQTISSSGFYNITENITDSGLCLYVTADNVIIEGNGYYLIGDDTSSGVYGSNSENLTVNNLNVLNYSNGVYFTEMNNSIINNTNISDSDLNGIVLTGSQSNDVGGFLNKVENVRIHQDSITPTSRHGATFGNQVTLSVHNLFINSTGDNAGMRFASGDTSPSNDESYFNNISVYTENNHSLILYYFYNGDVYFSDFLFNSTNAAGIMVSSRTTPNNDAFFYEGTINALSDYDLRNTYARVHLTNVNFDKDDLYMFGSSDRIYVAWTVTFNVTNALTGVILEDANVTSYDSGPALVATNLTNSSGLISQNLTEFIHYSSPTKTLKTNHTINVTKDLFYYNESEINLTVNEKHVFNVTLAPAPIEINDCQTISTEGNYLLNTSVESTGTCFTVTADDTEIDCDNYLVNYSTSGAVADGFNITGTNVTIKNCNISVDSAGTYARIGIGVSDSALRTTIFNNTFQIPATGSGFQAIDIASQANYSNISNNVINGLGAGTNLIYIKEDPHYLNISNNVINSSGTTSSVYGFRLEIINSTISHNVMDLGYRPYARGIQLTSIPRDINITNNTIQVNGTGARAISIISSDSGDYSYSDNINIINNTLLSFEATSAMSLSLYIDFIMNATITGNRFNSTANSGLSIDGTQASHFNYTFLNNTIEGLPIIYNHSLENQVVYEDVNLSLTHGIIICAFCNNVTYDNVTINTEGFQFMDSTNVTINNSNVNASSGYAIYFNDGQGGHNQILNSNIFVHSAYLSAGILASLESDNNFSIVNNIIKTIYGFAAGVYSSGYLHLENNTIVETTSGFSSVGVSLTSIAAGSTIYNNTINTYRAGLIINSGGGANISFNNLVSYNNALKLQGATGGDIVSNNQINCTGAGTQNTYASSPGVTFENNVFWQINNAQGIKVSSSNIFAENNTFYNSGYADTIWGYSGTNNTFSNSFAEGAIDISDAEVIFENVTFDREDIVFTVTPIGNLTVRWPIYFNLSNSSFHTLENVNVTANDSSARLEDYYLTHFSGFAQHLLTEFFENDTSRYYKSNYTITSTLAPYDVMTNYVNISYQNNSLIDIVLTQGETQPPSFDELPINESLELGDYLSQKINATDAQTAVDTFAVNDTNFTITSSGLLTNATFLNVSFYLLNITVTDTVDGNQNYTIMNVTVNDTVAPSLSLSSQAVTEGTGLSVQLSASDLSPLANWTVNETTNFTMSNSGLLTSLSTLNISTYVVNITVNDTYGNLAYDELTLTVNAATVDNGDGGGTTPPVETCSPSWSCGDWGTCSSETQTRSCTDSNACGTSSGKPSESQSCEVECVGLECIPETPEIVEVIEGTGDDREGGGSTLILADNTKVEFTYRDNKPVLDLKLAPKELIGEYRRVSPIYVPFYVYLVGFMVMIMILTAGSVFMDFTAVAVKDLEMAKVDVQKMFNKSKKRLNIKTPWYSKTAINVSGLKYAFKMPRLPKRISAPTDGIFKHVDIRGLRKELMDKIIQFELELPRIGQKEAVKKYNALGRLHGLIRNYLSNRDNAKMDATLKKVHRVLTRNRK